MNEARVELLQRMAVFGGIRADIIELILEYCPSATVAANDYFFRQSDPGDSMFVLEAGKVHVLKSWRDRDYILQTLNAGDCFGEMAVIDHGRRSASVRAIEDCRAIQISSAALHRIYGQDLKQFTLIQMNMGREVCRRLRDMDDRLFSFRLGNSEADLG